MNEPVHILSLGAGVQSSTLALMAACGEVTPMPVAAVFADTQDETKRLYRWLAWITQQLPYPVRIVTKGKLSDEAVRMRVSKKGKKYSRTDIPFFTRDLKTGKLGRIGGRACTRDYKIVQLIKYARKAVGREAMSAWRKNYRAELKEIKRIADEFKGKKYKHAMIARSEAWHACQRDPLAVQWVGISLDEVGRGKPSREPWIVVRHPLLEKRVTRRQCKAWMADHLYPEPPRSACKYCPFHDNEEWRRLRDDEPEEFAEAVAFERAVQAAKASSDNMDCIPFLHRSCVPLDQVDLRTDADHGQLSLWQDECEGMCGV